MDRARRRTAIDRRAKERSEHIDLSKLKPEDVEIGSVPGGNISPLERR